MKAILRGKFFNECLKEKNQRDLKFCNGITSRSLKNKNKINPKYKERNNKKLELKLVK